MNSKPKFGTVVQVVKSGNRFNAWDNDGNKLNNGDKIFLKKNNIENFKTRYFKIDYKEDNEFRVLIIRCEFSTPVMSMQRNVY